MARCGCGYNHEGKLVHPCVKHTAAKRAAVKKVTQVTLVKRQAVKATARKNAQ